MCVCRTTRGDDGQYDGYVDGIKWAKADISDRLDRGSHSPALL